MNPLVSTEGKLLQIARVKLLNKSLSFVGAGSNRVHVLQVLCVVRWFREGIMLVCIIAIIIISLRDSETL